MRYGLYSKLTARPGQRDALVAILLRDPKTLKALGCDLYVINLASDNPDVVWVTEVWTSREAHRASLESPNAKKAIAEAMPLLTGQFDRVELSVVGGLGLPERQSTTDSK
ncbi:MAG TPA: antibiotic biosynthesis monooxygenase [Blastocatellia bacterium]|nr:antibiotic biosynthesis monooxygenase [Blastocatellia bacterium]